MNSKTCLLFVLYAGIISSKHSIALNNFPFKPHVAYIILRTVSAERVRQGEVGAWGHPQGDMHMVAARLSCQSGMDGTVWANSCPGCMGRL